MKKILFFGDSITDAYRSRTDESAIGVGYPTLVKADLSYEHPGEYEFVNRGISGNRIVDLLARLKSDCINLKPDYISILIGVNDVWHEIAHTNGVDAKRFEIVYDLIISQIKESLPNTEIILMEPFVLEGFNTCNTEEIPDRLNRFIVGVSENGKAAQKIALKYNLPFIKLQDKFNQLAQKAPVSCWLADGVHPTTAGHKMIKQEWLKAFNSLSKAD